MSICKDGVRMAMLLTTTAASAIALAQHPTAVATIQAISPVGTSTGTLTITVNSVSATVPYGPGSTEATVAASFGAAFSADPIAERSPKLCTQGVCAKANGSTIMFQLKYPTPFTSVKLTSTPAVSPFQMQTSYLPTIPTAVSIIPSATTVSLGTSITVTAAVGPAAASGSFSFRDGSTPLGSAPVTGGSASFAISTLGLGTHSITAVYSGDHTFLPSSSSGTTVIVNTAAAQPGDPVITDVTPTSAPAGWTQIMISGSHFGASSGTLTLHAQSAAVAVSSWTDSVIVFDLLPTAMSGDLVVTVGTRPSNAIPFTVVSPVACSF